MSFIDRAKDLVDKVAEKIPESVKETAGDLRDRAGELAEKVGEHVPESVKETAGDLRDRAGDLVDKVVDKAKDTLGTAGESDVTHREP